MAGGPAPAKPSMPTSLLMSTVSRATNCSTASDRTSRYRCVVARSSARQQSPCFSSRPCRSFLNLHPGRLPSCRGVNPFAWSMLNQEDYAAWTLHHVDVEFDTGAIVDCVGVPLRD
ncbi:formyltransferase family protein [Mycobacterium pseudokansasii]